MVTPEELPKGIKNMTLRKKINLAAK